jgi:GT2 family glycosyltransferase
MKSFIQMQPTKNGFKEPPLTESSVRVSVIVCTMSREFKLVRCLRSIRDGTHKNIEIIVVDQTHPPHDSSFLEKIDPRIRHIRTQSRGLSRARNLGITLANAEIIAFTDDDCIVQPEWIKEIVECFSNHPDVVSVFGRVLAWPSGNDGITYVQAISENGTTSYCKSSSGLTCFALTDFPEEKIFSTTCLPYANLGSGNNMAFRRSWLIRIGAFIEDLGAGSWFRSGEDTELQYRILRLGLKMLYSPKPLVFHDRWLDSSHAKTVSEGYLLGVAAVFSYYSLMLDRLALHLLWFELKNAVNDCLKIAQVDRINAAICAKGVIFSWFEGILGGFILHVKTRFARQNTRAFQA